MSVRHFVICGRCVVSTMGQVTLSVLFFIHKSVVIAKRQRLHISTVPTYVIDLHNYVHESWTIRIICNVCCL